MYRHLVWRIEENPKQFLLIPENMNITASRPASQPAGKPLLDFNDFSPSPKLSPLQSKSRSQQTVSLPPILLLLLLVQSNRADFIIFLAFPSPCSFARSYMSCLLNSIHAQLGEAVNVAAVALLSSLLPLGVIIFLYYQFGFFLFFKGRTLLHAT